LIRCLAFIFLAAASSVDAAPNISETVKYYLVTGNTLTALRDAMKREGPFGFWGYTRWSVSWSRTCDVDLFVTITMPKLDQTVLLSQRDQRAWDAMIQALYRHEQIHAEHGRQAAAEIVASDCDKPRRIIKKWAERDQILDTETQHGRTQGVVLPD